MAVRNEASGRPPASSTARILAPLALLAVTVVLVIVVAASIGEQGGGGGDRGGGGDGRERSGATKSDRPPKQYVVQPNDSLVAIADEFGLTVEEIQRLNPGIDPQALVTGQELKLR